MNAELLHIRWYHMQCPCHVLIIGINDIRLENIRRHNTQYAYMLWCVITLSWPRCLLPPPHLPCSMKAIIH